MTGVADCKAMDRALRSLSPGFPGGSLVMNPLANTEDTVSNPWSGKIPHAKK